MQPDPAKPLLQKSQPSGLPHTACTLHVQSSRKACFAMENQAPGGAEPYMPSLPCGQQIEALGKHNPSQIENAQNVTPEDVELYWKLAGVAISPSGAIGAA